MGKQTSGTDGMEVPDTTNLTGNNSSDDDESVLQTLFRDHDVCIFCGGKFVC